MGHAVEPMSDFVQAAQITEAKQMFDRLQANLRRTIKGKDDVVAQVLVCLAAGGHLLIEDLPGLGKTTLAYALARSMDCTFARIQFTSDLLPSDVTGVAIYDETVKEFVFKRVLADEINRATPKTQSALLEVMDRGKVTIDGQAHAVGAPFMVFATQNPVDYEGTFPLPESQTARFLMRLQMGYPQGADELDILRTASLGYDAIEINPVVTRGDVIKLQALARQVFVEDSVLEFILKIVAATRT
jgi:MoxR-like ATPase